MAYTLTVNTLNDFLPPGSKWMSETSCHYDFVPLRFRAITISCHFGDFVPPIGFMRGFFHTY